MLNLSNATSELRVQASVASTLDVHCSWVDRSGSTDTPSSDNTLITNTTKTNVSGTVPASTVRNVRTLVVTNNNGATTVVSIFHYDGTTEAELFSVTLLSGENVVYSQNGEIRHHAANGGLYAADGTGAYTGRSIDFMKASGVPEAVGNYYCTSKDAGYPSAWAVGTPGINGRATDGTAAGDLGCVPIANPTTGANYLTELLMSGSSITSHEFFDCLWVNSGIVVTTTTLQSITSGAMPARDLTGSTNGVGNKIGLLWVAASTNAGVITNTTVTYTNQAGTGSRTAILSTGASTSIPITPVIGTLVWFQLQAGDTGVQSIQGITLGTSLVTGTVSLMVARSIAKIGSPTASVMNYRKISDPGIRLYNNVCLLHSYLAQNTNAVVAIGELTVTEK